MRERKWYTRLLGWQPPFPWLLILMILAYAWILGVPVAYLIWGRRVDAP